MSRLTTEDMNPADDKGWQVDPHLRRNPQCQSYKYFVYTWIEEDGEGELQRRKVDDQLFCNKMLRVFAFADVVETQCVTLNFSSKQRRENEKWEEIMADSVCYFSIGPLFTLRSTRFSLYSEWSTWRVQPSTTTYSSPPQIWNRVSIQFFIPISLLFHIGKFSPRERSGGPRRQERQRARVCSLLHHRSRWPYASSWIAGVSLKYTFIVIILQRSSRAQSGHRRRDSFESMVAHAFIGISFSDTSYSFCNLRNLPTGMQKILKSPWTSYLWMTARYIASRTLSWSLNIPSVP